MKRNRKQGILTTLLALALFLAGCGGETETKDTQGIEKNQKNESSVESGGMGESEEEAPASLLPYEGEEVTFSYFWFDVGSDYSDETLPIVQALKERMGNIKLDMQIIAGNDYWTKVPVVLAGGDIPDMMIIGEVHDNLSTYGQNGVFLDWAPLMEKYMPNIYKYAQERAMFNGLKDEQGHIYAIPLSVSNDDYVMQNWMVNVTLLNKLNIELPRTQEEFLDACRKVKEETGITPVQQRWGMAPLEDTMGLMYKHEGDRGLSYYPDEGKWSFGPTRDDSELKSYLTFMHTLWEENLIDHEINTMSDEQLDDYLYSGQFAFAHDYQSMFSNSRNDSDVPFTEVSDFEIGIMATPRGTGAKISIDNAMDGRCTWGVVSDVNTEHPELLASCIDLMFSEEIATFDNYGIEGESYEIAEDGTKRFTDKVKAASTNYVGEIGLDELGSDRSPWLRTFGITDVNAQRLKCESPEIYAGVNKIYDRLDAGELEPRYAYPYPSLSIEENTEISDIMAPVQTYLDECRVKFIMGDMNLETDWDTFMTNLKGYGDTDRVCEILNSKEMPTYVGRWR